MVTSSSYPDRYRTGFSNSEFNAFADTTRDKGGGGAGFRPHDLLEAALATCLNMEIRIFADRHDIPIEEVRTAVTLDRSLPDQSLFRYSVDLKGPISEQERRRLLRVADACSIHKTLSRNLQFKRFAST